MRKIVTIIMFLVISHCTIWSSEPPVSVDTTFNQFRFGGYGEMVATFKDYGINRFNGTSYGNTKIHHSEISIPRFVLAFDYKFNKDWILGAEVEFEYGGTGVAYELENTENGEYETEIEKGGEVAIEQFHITRLIMPELNVRAGHLIVPVGLVNSHHEPINFFGTMRPEGTTTIIPCTWHSTGLELFGSFGKGAYEFDYELMVVAGLNANGFDRNGWVKGGKQGLFEKDNFTSPAFVARLNYNGLRNLRLGASLYHCANTGANSDKLVTYDEIGKIPVTLYSFDAQYSGRYVTARADYISGHVAHADAVGGKNGKLSNKSGYSRLHPVAKRAVAFDAELGLNLKNIFSGSAAFPVVVPFAQYEYYNPQQKAAGMDVMDKRCQVSKWTFGANWKPLRNLVVKADFTTRQIGTDKVFGKGSYNSENEFSIGLAYIGWFIKH